jgi:hypothetical protein
VWHLWQTQGQTTPELTPPLRRRLPRRTQGMRALAMPGPHPRR